MSNLDKQFVTLCLEASNFYETRNYDKALKKVNKALSLKKDNVKACNLKAAILIEFWNGDAKNKHWISEAIDHLKKAVETDPKNKMSYFMNLGNAYCKRAKVEIGKTNSLNKEIVRDLESAKQCFEKSLEINEKQPGVWVNKGNTLDYLGRHFEALYCYDKAIIMDSEKENAWGCKGICYEYLSNVIENEDDKSALFLNCMLCMAIEFENNPTFEINESYKSYIVVNLQQNKTEVDNFKETLKDHLQNKHQTINERFNLFTTYDGTFEDFYLDFCESHDLFLNTYFDCIKCGNSTLDLIETSFLSDINDYERPYEFFKRWYSLIDDYKTSRFYLSLSQYKHSDFSFLDKLRYEPDYSLNYLPNVELLKTAFLMAINIYDKAAFFLNDYEELGLHDSKVAFWGSNSIFKKTDIMEKNDWDTNLVALYTTVSDLEKNELTKFADFRNYLVHRYLVFHDIVDAKSLTYPYSNNEIPLKNPEYHIDIHEFYQCTIYAMRQLKTVLYAISFFISKKEKEKEKRAEGRIGKLEWTHNWDENDELTKAADDLANKLKSIYSEAFESFLDNIDDIDKEQN